MKKRTLMKGAASLIGITSGLTSVLSVAACAKKEYTEGEILIERTDLNGFNDSSFLTGRYALSFNVIALKNQSMTETKIHFQFEKYAPDYLPNEFKEIVKMEEIYDQENNILGVTAIITDGLAYLKGSISFYATNGNLISNKKTYTIWTLPYKWSDYTTLEVGQNIDIRDKYDAREAIDYIKSITDPLNTSLTYNEVLITMKFTFQDVLNCLLGIGNCPFEFPTTNNMNTVSENNEQLQSVFQDDNAVHITTPTNSQLTLSSSTNTSLGFLAGRSPKLLSQANQWTNAQLWVDALYGASWKVLSNASLFFQWDWKNNNNNATNFPTDKIPVATLTDRNYYSQTTSDKTYDQVVTLPFVTGVRDSSSHVDDVKAMPTLFEQQLESLYRTNTMPFGEQDPSLTATLSIGTMQSGFIYIEESINNGISGWSLIPEDEADVTTLTLQLANIEILHQIQNYWFPSYWLLADNQLDPGRWSIDTFLD